MDYPAIQNNIGKKTNGSNLNLPPESADLLENFETVRDGIYRKPRGRNTNGTFASAYPNILNLMDYNDYLIASIGNTSAYELHWIDYINSLIYQYNGTYTEPRTGFKVRNVNINKNTYFTTNDGIKVLDKINGTIIPSGVPKAIGFDAYLDATLPTWLNGGMTTAYRCVWSRTDNNKNLIVGAPSERVDISNPLTTGNYLSIKLDIYMPINIINLYTSYGVTCKLSIYRATQMTGAPAEDFQLCYEAVPSATDFTNEMYSFIDVCPDSLRGAALYSNTMQEGIAQSNYQAPMACCIDQYKNYMLLGNIKSIHRMDTNLISTKNLIRTSELNIYDSGNSNIGGGITGAVTAGGLIKITTATAHHLTTGQYVYIKDVTGTTEANGTWKITYVDATKFTLDGSTFADAWISGGNVTNGVNVKFMRYDTNVGGSGINQNDGIVMMANNTGGKVRVTTKYYHGLVTGDYVQIMNVRAGSTVEANGSWLVTYPTAGGTPTTKDFDILSCNYVNPFLIATADTHGTCTTADITANYATIAVVTDGKIKITVDGVDNQLSGIKLTGCNTLPLIAAKLQPLLTDASVTYGATGIIISSNSTGIVSKVSMGVGIMVGTDLCGATFFKVTSTPPTIVDGATAVEAGHINLVTNRGAVGTSTGGITAIANNGSGKCRFSTAGIHGLLAGDYVRIYGLTGTPLANGIHEVLYTSAVNRFDIDIAYVGNGTGSCDLYEDLALTPVGTGIRAFRHTTGTDAQNIAMTSLSIVKALNLGYPNTIVQAYYTSGITDAPGKIMLEAITLSQLYFYLNSNTTATGSNFSPVVYATGTDNQSINDDNPNSMAICKQDEYESFPLSNTRNIGNKGDPILGVMAMKDCAYIVKKKDGVWKLVGDTLSNFVISKFYDAECLQINSICKGQNSMFLMTSQGRLRISDTGVEQISADNLYEDMSVVEDTNFDSGYGWFYDTENSYMLATHKDVGDTYNTYVSVYNGKSQNWWDWTSGIYTNDPNIGCGVIIRNKCYTAGVDGLTVYEERKDFAVTDFCTADIGNSIAAVGDIDTSTNIVTFVNGIVVPLESYIVQGNFTKSVVEVISSNQLRLNNVLNLSDGLVTHKVPIISKVRFQQCSCGFPQYEKSFNSISCFFDDRETDITNLILRTHTDQSKTEQETYLSPLISNYWGYLWGGVWGTLRVTDRWLTEPPKEHSRGNYIYIEFEHRLPEEQCAISGYSLNYDATTAKYESK